MRSVLVEMVWQHASCVSAGSEAVSGGAVERSGERETGFSSTQRAGAGAQRLRAAGMS